jgi:hypothetical protein
MNRNELREVLAALAHEQWSGWLRWQLSSSEQLADGRVALRAGLAERWRRQMTTPYAELSEGERNSDRLEADLVLIGPALLEAEAQLRRARMYLWDAADMYEAHAEPGKAETLRRFAESIRLPDEAPDQ